MSSNTNPLHAAARLISDALTREMIRDERKDDYAKACCGARCLSVTEESSLEWMAGQIHRDPDTEMNPFALRFMYQVFNARMRQAWMNAGSR